MITATCANSDCHCDIDEKDVEEFNCGHILCDACLIDAISDGCPVQGCKGFVDDI